MKIEVEGLEETIQLMVSYPRKLNQAMKRAMEAALLVVWGHIPSYPPPPTGSKYVRTGQLGRSLGSDFGGGRGGGTPDVYEVKTLGSGEYVGRFGTNLEYAPLVIGDSTTEQSDKMRHWWTLPQTVVGLSKDGVRKVFLVLKEEMVRFLEKKA